MENQTEGLATESVKLKYCKHCGTKIPEDAVICMACGRQVEELKSGSAQPNIIINNDNTNLNSNVNRNTLSGSIQGGRQKDKWVSLLLCVFFGVFGGHKFYEGKIGMGILYLCTLGLFGVGVVIDFIALLAKPNPYYV